MFFYVFGMSDNVVPRKFFFLRDLMKSVFPFYIIQPLCVCMYAKWRSENPSILNRGLQSISIMSDIRASAVQTQTRLKGNTGSCGSLQSISREIKHRDRCWIYKCRGEIRRSESRSLSGSLIRILPVSHNHKMTFFSSDTFGWWRCWCTLISFFFLKSPAIK